jgi:hypothetical protein
MVIYLPKSGPILRAAIRLLRDWPYGNDAASATIIDGIQVNFFTAATHVGVHMSLEFMV